MTRCLFYYHDGGKTCETCECPGRVAYAPRRAPARSETRPRCVICGERVVAGPRCISCAAKLRESPEWEEFKAEESMRRAAPLKERYSA